MRSQPFPNCCGGAIFYGFGGTSTDSISGTNEYTDKQINDALVQMEQQWSHRGFAQIVLDKFQKKFMHPLLKKRGYRCVINGVYHPGHRSRLSIYIKELNKR